MREKEPNLTEKDPYSYARALFEKHGIQFFEPGKVPEGWDCIKRECSLAEFVDSENPHYEELDQFLDVLVGRDKWCVTPAAVKGEDRNYKYSVSVYVEMSEDGDFDPSSLTHYHDESADEPEVVEYELTHVKYTPTGVPIGLVKDKKE